MVCITARFFPAERPQLSNFSKPECRFELALTSSWISKRGPENNSALSRLRSTRIPGSWYGSGGRPKEIPRGCITHLVFCRYAGPLCSCDVGQVSFELPQDGIFSSKCRPGKDQPGILRAPSTPTSPRGRSLVHDKALHAKSENNLTEVGSSCRLKKLSSPHYYFINNFRRTHGTELQLRGVKCSPLSAPLSKHPRVFPSGLLSVIVYMI
jgi:hypothetical protein